MAGRLLRRDRRPLPARATPTSPRPSRPDEEAFALYEALTRWADWCEAAYWLLLRWYGPENPCPRLRLPLPDLHDGDGHRLVVVRELRGVPGEVLLEDALWHWRAQLSSPTG